MLLIQHRFGDISGGLYELFGLDQASMRIGFEYGLGKGFNAGIGRSTYLKTFDGFIKQRIVGQSESFPFTAVLTAGASVPTIKNYFPETANSFSDKLSSNLQLHVAKTFEKLAFQVSSGFMRTGYLIEEAENLDLFTLGVGASVKLGKKVSANIEYLHPFHEKLSGAKPLSLGVDIDTGGHLFQLMISNNQRMFDQAVYTQTSGDWSTGNLFFGFNLIREFRLKYY
jgi:hypothetical protein